MGVNETAGANSLGVKAQGGGSAKASDSEKRQTTGASSAAPTAAPRSANETVGTGSTTGAGAGASGAR